MSHKLHIIFMQLVRNIIAGFGGVLLSRQNFENIIAQRDLAVSKLTVIENDKLKAGLVGIVFSKDRALQLYSLLVSYYELVSNRVPLTVIYATSTKEHSRSYDDVKKMVLELNLDVRFVEESEGFRNSLLKTLDDVCVKNIFFLVDDIIFLRKVDLDFAIKIDTSRYVLSLRHSPYLTKSYTANKNQLPPKLSEFKDQPGVFEFSWFEKGCEWSDPWSVDGQILSTSEVKMITKVSNFKAPNSYESSLKSFNSFCVLRRGLCYSESKIINLPINRVQNECDNFSGSVSAEYLLEQWNRGMMLDTDSLLTHVPISPHEEHLIKLKKRPHESSRLEQKPISEMEVTP